MLYIHIILLSLFSRMASSTTGFEEELDAAEPLVNLVIPPHLRTIMQICFETLQEEFRIFFSRPSYATVLRTGMKLKFIHETISNQSLTMLYF